MNAARYWIDEAHALYEDRGGAVESNEEVKKGLGDMVGIKRI